MKKEALNKILDELKIVFRNAFLLALESDVGINNKVGFNTLIDSNLYNESKSERNEFTFSIFYNFYYDYIVSGRKPQTKRVPINALKDWAVRKHIPSDNNTLYAIRESIYKHGIRGRNLTVPFEENIDVAFEKYSEKLIDGILEEVTNYFNS